MTTGMAIRVEPAALRLVEELFVIHVDAVFNVAYRVVWSRPDAEDVVQATFIKAFTRLDQLKDRDRIRPWLLQVAYREAITVIRRRRDVPVDPAEFPERRATGPGPDDVAVAADVASALGRALASLSEGERMAVCCGTSSNCRCGRWPPSWVSVDRRQRCGCIEAVRPSVADWKDRICGRRRPDRGHHL